MNGYWDVKQTNFPGILHTTSLILATSEGEKFFEGKFCAVQGIHGFRVYLHCLKAYKGIFK